MKYSRYQSYKESGVEWLSEIPNHWEHSRLRWIATRYAGGTPSKANLEYWSNGEIPWINSGAVNQRLITEASAYITEDALNNSSTKWVPSGALVMALAGQGKTKGMVAQVNFDTTCNQSMAAIVPNSKISPRFLYWYLTGHYMQIRNMASGELRDGLNLEMIGSIPCPLLASDEQEAIAAFLDHETAQIDTLIAKQQQLIELLQEKRQALISHAVTKGLNPAAPMKNSGIEWLGETPQHWTAVKFPRCTQITNGQVNPQDEPYRSMILVAPNHIESGTGRITYLETSEEQAAISGKYYCRTGDVIYSKIRPALAKVCIAPKDCLCSADMYPIQAKNGLVNQFLFWYMLSMPFTLKATLESERVAMPKVNRETLATFYIPVPPIEEQHWICEHLRSQCAKIDVLIDKAIATINVLGERRTALISAAVTGKIDVRSLVN